MRVLTNMEMAWISGGFDSVDPITVEPPSDGGGDDGGWDFPDPTDGGDDNGGGSEGSGGGGGGGSAGEIAGAIGEIVKAMKDINWDQLGVSANEWVLRATGGYGHETIDQNRLQPLVTADGVTIYTSDNGNMYGDRDGNNIIDTGILYNPDTGVLSADFDCNGTGDQFIIDLKP